MRGVERRIAHAISILMAIGMPPAQQNERSALCLLALLGVAPRTPWSEATAPLLGITPIMIWVRDHYGRLYAPNTRETFRRQTMHQLVAGGVASYNPDDPGRAVNSPRAVYQVSREMLDLARCFASPKWDEALADFLAGAGTLAGRYAAERQHALVAVRLSGNQVLELSPGEHSSLIRAVIEQFAPRFAPGSVLVHAGDTGAKWAYLDSAVLEGLGVRIDSHGKMPDVVLHDVDRGWLLLVEACASHGPMDAKRRAELTQLFAGSRAGLVFVTAFPTRRELARHLGDIAWETEVWVADSPSHMIHLDGTRFLGPYTT
jgi:hypothetical protein